MIRTIRYSIATVVFIMAAMSTVGQMVSTIAGNGATGFLSGAYGGDGGPATAALLYYPGGLAYDASGNLYIADSRNHRIRKIDAAGVITTFAGTGVTAYTGDGGPATAADMSYPESIAFDGAGNMYFSDHWDACVRKIDASGIITTVAGTGVYGYSGDGGPATAAMLDNPCHVLADGAGNLYICDWVNARVRKVNTAGIITTIAGNGLAPFSGDGGPATAAGMRPSSTVIDAIGNILVCDGVNRRVRKIDAAGTITTIAGIGGDGYSGDGGPATAAQFRYMAGMVFDTLGNLLIADQSNNVVRKIDAAGIITTIAGTGTQGYSGDGGPATAARFRYPTMMTISPTGKLLVSDMQNNRVREMDMTLPTTTKASRHEGELRFVVKPNPAIDEVIVGEIETGTELNVYNIQGQKMLTVISRGGNERLNISALPEGLYVVKAQDAYGKTFCKQFIKN